MANEVEQLKLSDESAYVRIYPDSGEALLDGQFSIEDLRKIIEAIEKGPKNG